ncbi:YggT family protein [Vampirovibrio sp.]|uniref:YggT family protein n=1 Tax=Vampirovibrio sp. TaxID=2717857 RepID=UPI0035931C0D
MTEALLILIKLIGFYRLILLGRILLTWLPNINWYNQPFKFIRDITDPVLAPFSRLIPTIGGIDFSPMLLFFVLQLLERGLYSIAVSQSGQSVF